MEGSVHYPIRNSRKPCGGLLLRPGVRTYGPKDKLKDRFDAFCFTSSVQGRWRQTKGAIGKSRFQGPDWVQLLFPHSGRDLVSWTSSWKDGCGVDE